MQKVRIATLHLEQNTFVWYRWLCSHKKNVTWSIFMEEMIAHYEDTKSNTFFIQLINLKQKCSVGEHIEDFQKLNIRATDIPEEHRIDVFIGTLKDNIQHEVRVWELDSLEKPFRLERKINVKLWRITTPQTLKIEGHIKNKKVVALIDSSSTHNFIHCKAAKELNCFLYPALEYQVMVANGGTINFSGKCHNIKLTMGKYVLNSPMLSIPMGGVDVVLGVQWLQSLGTIAFNFQELFLKFFSEGKEVEL